MSDQQLNLLLAQIAKFAFSVSLSSFAITVMLFAIVMRIH